MLLQKFRFLGLPFQGNVVDFAGEDVVDRIPFEKTDRTLDTGFING
jgi:hypothetical protein